MTVLAVIPARYGSSRLPGKPLLSETGKPLIQHVVEQVRQAVMVQEVVVATDDARIAAAVGAFGATAVMTSPECASGTDRVAEVARQRPDADILVNVQGDEPEVSPTAINALVSEMLGPDRPGMATLGCVTPAVAIAGIPSAVKVVVTASGVALYFSRAAVPFDREEDGPGAGTLVRHVGLYAYRRQVLLRLADLPPSELEQREKLEQLRALEAGIRIKVALVDEPGTGIDTPADYAAFVDRWRAAHG